MAKRRTKKRTHVRAENPNAGVSKNGTASMNRSPKSMVIRTGASEVGPSVSQLVKDVRQMMEPDTASRLKVRRDEEDIAFPYVALMLIVMRAGTKRKQIKRLYYDGRAIGRYPSASILEIQYRKHQHATCASPSRADPTFQS